MARRWALMSLSIALTLFVAPNIALSTPAEEAARAPDTAATNVSAIAAVSGRYSGQSVLSATPASDAAVVALRTYLTSEDSRVDVWRSSSQPNESVHFRVGAGDLDDVETFLTGQGIPFERLIPDVERLVSAHQPSVRGGGRFGWDNFYRIDDIYAWLESVAAQYPDVAAVVDGGRSYEGRLIRGIRIAHAEGLPVLYLEGGIHAREWISPAAATFILHQLLSSTDPQVQRLARSFEWHIFPSVNPDGYEFSHTTDRFWRKTRSRTTINCYGADPNRNWETAWGVTGVSWRPCSDTFPGVRAVSELETLSRAKYMEPLMDRMKAFIALHSYGQCVLFPWGFTHSKTANHAEMLEVGRAAAQAIYNRSNLVFRVGNLADTLYEAGGSSMDWAYRNGARFSFTIELRDRGQFGFLLPADQIPDAVRETMDAVMTMASEVLRRT